MISRSATVQKRPLLRPGRLRRSIRLESSLEHAHSNVRPLELADRAVKMPGSTPHTVLFSPGLTFSVYPSHLCTIARIPLHVIEHLSRYGSTFLSHSDREYIARTHRIDLVMQGCGLVVQGHDRPPDLGERVIERPRAGIE